jgi:hypothetical protein
MGIIGDKRQNQTLPAWEGFKGVKRGCPELPCIALAGLQKDMQVKWRVAVLM